MFDRYSLANLPPESKPEDVGKFGQYLLEESLREREYQGLVAKWVHSYAMYRGDHWQQRRGYAKKSKTKVTVNLFFSNVRRTVANVTARKPVAEVVDLQTANDLDAHALTAKMKQWWKDTKQQSKLKESILKMEKYGITVEHPVWVGKRNRADIIVMDCFACFPAPGNWSNFDEDCPYFIIISAENCDTVDAEYELPPGTVKPDEVYSTMGEGRRETRPVPSNSYPGVAAATGNYADVNMHPVQDAGGGILQRRALVVELWIRDNFSTETISEDVVDSDIEGNPVVEKRTRKKYPDGIRRIKFTNRGLLVLEDQRNPNLQWGHPMESLLENHAWGRLPFYKANSYIDTTSPWGFSAIDQVGDLNKKVDEIVSRLLAWVMRVMYPPLIVAKETGITRDMINNNPNLVLMVEKVAHVAGIRYEPVPNLPSNFIEILNIILTFFDRIYQIEDADRGVGPKGVIAASAIVALQERNAVLIQEKITSADSLVENRGKWNLAMEQNFGTKELIEVDGETRTLRGMDMIGRKFNFVVESGSTMPRTSLQLEEQAKELYDKGAIDRQALLESLNFPGWKKIIERSSEGQVDQALQILIAAGLDKDTAYALRAYVMEQNQGPGGSNTKGGAGGTKEAGAPKSTQTAKAPVAVKQNRKVGAGV